MAYDQASLMDPKWVQERVDDYVARMTRVGMNVELAMGRAAEYYLRSVFIVQSKMAADAHELSRRFIEGNMIPHAIRAQEVAAAYHRHACEARRLFNTNHELMKDQGYD